MADVFAQRQENETDEPSSTTSIEYMLPACTQAVQLPTELIDMIIHEANNMLWGFKLCSACSLVCRQWRDIALPYLFRDLHLPNGDREVEECLMFFVSRPTLAGLVEFVDISALHGINLVHLDSLIGCFSNIRALHISCCTFLHPAELPTSSHHKYTLVQFVWYEDADVHENDEESPTSWLRPLLEILSLFSDISHIELDFGEEWELYEIPDRILQGSGSKNSRHGPLQISSLSFKRSPTRVVSIVQSYLTSSNALSNITRLALDLLEPKSMAVAFNEMLSLIGSQLRYLHIGLPRDWDWTDIWSSSSNYTDRPLVAHFLPGFSACINLEEFGLSAILWADSEVLEGVIVRSFHVGWPTIVHLLLLIPTDRLHAIDLHVELRREPTVEALDSKLEPDFVHLLPWERLRDACRRFTRLRSLQFWPDISEFGSRKGDPDHRLCLKYELREFESIMRGNNPWDLIEWSALSESDFCDHTSCVMYNSRFRASPLGLDNAAKCIGTIGSE